MATVNKGFLGLGRLARRRRPIQKGPSTTPAPTNQKSVQGKATASTKGMVQMEEGRRPASPTGATVNYQNAQAGTTRPPTLQQSNQIAAEQQAYSSEVDSTDYSQQVDQLVSGLGKAGPLNFAQRKAQNEFRKQVEAAKAGGLTRQELEQLHSGLAGQQFKGFEKGAQKFQSSTTEALKGMLATAPGVGGAAGGAGTGNPFMEGTVAEEYRPRVGQIEEQLITQADQQAASEQAQKDYALGIDQSVQDTTGRMGERVEGLQDTATQLHGEFTDERRAMQEDLQNMPDRVAGKFDEALAEFTRRTDTAQGIIDDKEAAALAEVSRGQSMAMTAAVQGTQGQINSQIAQINSNPNLTDSQKASMTAQVRMAGAASIGPQVGQTVLGFNELAARTATQFGQMTTQIQDTGLRGSQDLLARGAAAYENTNIAAKNLGVQLLQTQANADNNYLTTMANMEATRSQIEMTGDTLRASLIPEMGIPYPDYANAMATGLQMDVSLMNRDFQNTMGRDMMAFQMQMAMNQSKGSFFQSLASMFSMIPGPWGQVGMAGSMLLGNAAQGNMQPPASMMGGYSQAGNYGPSF